MVKPALPYLDVIREASRLFSIPISAYSVSGEYVMLKAAAEKNALNERNVVLEVTRSIFRAGATFLMTYYAKEIAAWNASCKAGPAIPTAGKRGRRPCARFF